VGLTGRGHPLSRIIIGVGVALVGVAMMLGGPEAYTSPTYTVVFDLAADLSPGDIAPTTVWGIAFLVMGVATLLPLESRGRLIVAALLGGLIIAWSLGLIFYVLDQVQDNGVTTTWGGPLWPFMVGVLVLVNLGRARIR
jgi:xanthine/uracil permease